LIITLVNGFNSFLTDKIFFLKMPRKRISESNIDSKSSVLPSKSIRRSIRTKRGELKDERLSNEEAVQEVLPENGETQPKPSVPKKRTKPISPASKSTHTKKARNEQQQVEETKIDEVPDNGSHESELIKGKNKGKNKVIEPSYENNTENASSASFMSLKSLFTEKLNIITPLSDISKDSSVKMNIDESDPLVQAKWEKTKAKLFEVPREPLPAYHEYQDRLFTKQPWMKKKDVDHLQKLFTDPKSMLAKKQLKVSIFIRFVELSILFF
jgi:hypothetical protein